MSGQKKKRRRFSLKKCLSRCMLLFVAGYILYSCIGQELEIWNRKCKLRDTTAQVQVEKQKSVELEAKKKVVSTPEYIEKIARNDLGFVAPDEKIFMDSLDK